jgi:hypothetical protein
LQDLRDKCITRTMDDFVWFSSVGALGMFADI